MSLTGGMLSQIISQIAISLKNMGFQGENRYYVTALKVRTHWEETKIRVEIIGRYKDNFL